MGAEENAAWQSRLASDETLRKRLRGLGGASEDGQVVFTAYPNWSVAGVHDGEIRVATGTAPPRSFITKIPLVRQMALLIHQLQTGGHAKAALHGKPKKMPNPWLAPARGLFAALVYLLAVGILLGAVTQLVDWVNRVLPFSDLANGISTVLLAPILVWTAFGLMVLTSLILPSVRGMCRMHAAEHKVIAAFESYGPEWARFSHDMDKEHIRCGTTNVSLIVMMIAAIDAVLAIWIADPALRFGAALVYVPFVDGLVVQLLTWPATRYAISRPGRFLQKLTTLHPEQQHMDLAHKGFAPLAVELERNN